jgi:hypothetical protein
MPSKKTAAQKTTRNPSGGVSRVAAEPEVEERRAALTSDGDETVVEPTDDTTAAETSSPVPNVQSEANSGSTAAEDTRDGGVAEPNT